MNKPYVKQYAADGTLLNPIGLAHEGFYKSQGPNRRQKRAQFGKSRFTGNGFNFHLSFIGNFKYRRRKQLILEKSGNIKKIEHYDPKVIVVEVEEKNGKFFKKGTKKKISKDDQLLIRTKKDGSMYFTKKGY